MWQCLGVNFVCYIEVFSDKLCNALCEASQQLDKINIRDVPLLSASVTVVNTSLTVNCRWTRTLLLSAGAVTTN